ncbi:hypothetical protein [Myroides sp. DF42-4-2]|uniref:hypothetical protein n=1 Tax=unclassified Myroides TaxID=2642485 RepID=UPI0025786A31|nr:hypothetical protein [Myroides sp. DF42-4-2]MDM1408760.1 hypothetical protein [Myroides sp. DF42-4-2]
MRKFLVLLFICVFSQTSFATRILEIRNNSDCPKTFYAIQLMHYSPIPEDTIVYRFSLDPITLEPHQFVRFSQYTMGDNITFPYCIESQTPHNKYVIHNYCDYLEELYYKEFRWWHGDSSPFTHYYPQFCNEVPPYVFFNDIKFQGFKLCQYNPLKKNGTNCDIIPVTINSTIESLALYDRDNRNQPGYLNQIQYQVIRNNAIYHELVTLNNPCPY